MKKVMIKMFIFEILWVLIAVTILVEPIKRIWYRMPISEEVSITNLIMVPRFIAVAIISFITFLFYAKKYAKQLPKSNAKKYKAFLIILPVVIALIIMVHGLKPYINSNSNEVESQLDSSSALYQYMQKKMGTTTRDREIAVMIESGIYLITGEIAVLLAFIKLDKLFLPEEEKKWQS